MAGFPFKDKATGPMKSLTAPGMAVAGPPMAKKKPLALMGRKRVSSIRRPSPFMK